MIMEELEMTDINCINCRNKNRNIQFYDERSRNIVVPNNLGITLRQELYGMKLLSILDRCQAELYTEMEIISVRCRSSGRSQTTDEAGDLFVNYIQKLEEAVTIDIITSQKVFTKLKAKDQLVALEQRFKESDGYYQDLTYNLKELYLNHLFNGDINHANLELIIEIYRSNSGAILTKLIDKIIGSAALLYIFKKIIGY